MHLLLSPKARQGKGREGEGQGKGKGKVGGGEGKDKGKGRAFGSCLNAKNSLRQGKIEGEASLACAVSLSADSYGLLYNACWEKAA